MSQFSVPWTPKPKQEFRGIARRVAGLARLVARLTAPLLRTAPGAVFLAAVVATVVFCWVTRLAFEYTTSLATDAQINLAATGGLGADLTAGEIASGLRRDGWPRILAYPLWPAQFRLVRDLTGLLAIIGLVSINAMFAIWWERKVAGRIQSRCGPMRVGGWHGWAQSPADGIKLLTKEDLIPADADGPLFRAAPYLAFVPALCAFFALPFGAYWVFRDLDVGLIFILAMLGLEVFGVILAGWASNNKWSVYGAMREACQMVSYEIPMGISLLVPVMTTGTLQLTAIAAEQDGGWFSWLAFRNPFTFVALGTYYTASLASCKRAPFDLPEGESELVAGFHTEYSGIRWSFFFFAEYAAMFVVSALATTLFLGAWYSPLPASWAAGLGTGLLGRLASGLLFDGPLWFLAKCLFLIYVQMWLRWTLPRIRIDQVLYSCVQVMLPLTMVLLLGNTVWELFNTGAYPRFAALDKVVNVVVGLLGMVMAGGFVAIMLYGRLNRRRLVGTLAVDLRPGS